MTLILDPNLTHHDDLYATLLDAHDGLSETDSAMLNARLLFVLFNHIGDPEVIRAAITVARDPKGAAATP